MKTTMFVGAALVGFALASPVASAGNDDESIRGEVVQVGPVVDVPGEGRFDTITVRTRDRQMRQLVLGPAGSCLDCVAVGDRVRTRAIQRATATEMARVRTMECRRTGERFTFRDGAGQPAVTRARQRFRQAGDAPNGTGGSRGRRGSGAAHGRRGGGPR